MRQGAVEPVGMDIQPNEMIVMVVLCVLVLIVQAAAVFLFFRRLKRLDLH